MTELGQKEQERGRIPLPVEISFLERFGVDPAILDVAAATARVTGVTGDRALLSEGHLSAHQFYEFLARHLDLPYMRHPMPLGLDIRLDQAAILQSVRLAPNAAGLDYVYAPRGETLVALLRQTAARSWSSEGRIIITTPQRLAALVRLSHRDSLVRHASHALPEWNARLSAHTGWNPGQLLFGFAAGVAIGAGAWFAPGQALLAMSLLCSAVFFAMVLVRLAAACCSPVPQRLRATRKPDSSLPVYTVVVPLYREARIVPRLIAALNGLDYPLAKLDIKIVVEADDHETHDALERQHLPDRFEIITAPAGVPKTKPRALNVALRFATGHYLVVYDAEDEPEADQLRLAVDQFEAGDPQLGCLQGRLVIDNANDSWISGGIMAQMP